MDAGVSLSRERRLGEASVLVLVDAIVSRRAAEVSRRLGQACRRDLVARVEAGAGRCLRRLVERRRALA
jgi:hypothetical protein